MPDTADRIERQIGIDADPQRVWALVSEPGWWINGGAITPHRTTAERDDVTVVDDPVHGEFRIATLARRAPEYAAFHWLPRDPDDDPVTLVEFWIDPHPGGGVVLRVAESGFAAQPDEARRRAHRHDNAEGWNAELAAARRHLTAS